MENKIKITEEGQPCRHCQHPVTRQSHTKPPKFRKNAYYFEWWFRCGKCGAMYMVESARRLHDQPQAALFA